MSDLIDTYNESNGNTQTDLNSGGSKACGQSFVGNGEYLAKATFFITRALTPSGNMVAKLYALTGTPNSNAVPTGAALATSSPVSAGVLTASYALYDFTFDGTYVLQNGTNYFIVLEFLGGDSTNKVRVRKDSTSPTHSGNGAIQGSDSVWFVEGTAIDYVFYVYGNVATAPTITSSAPAAGLLNTAYTHTYTATGDATITYAVQSGALPTGLSLSSDGHITGTPTVGGTFTGTVRATNGVGTNDQAFSITITTPPTITSSAPAAGTLNVAYTHDYTATGDATITYAVQSGALPTGLSLSSDGHITGTPTVAGLFTGTVRATNSSGTNDQNFSINIPAVGGVHKMTMMGIG